MLPLQFHMSFGCFHLIGAELSDSATCKAWEASEPSLVDGIEPGGDWWSAHGHVIEVDKTGYGFNGDTVCSIEGLIMELCLCWSTLACVPPWKFAWVGAASNINHVKFSSFVKGTK